MTATAQAQPVRWWLVLVQGILSIIIGILFLTNPAITSASFVLVLGIYWLILGVLDIIHIFQDRTAWGWKLFSGIIGILAGLFIIGGFLWRDSPLAVTFAVGTAFVIVLGVMGVIYGIIGLVQAFQGAGWGPGILGVLTIIFGLYLMFQPLAAALALPIVLGIFLIIGGIFLIIMAFRLR